MSCTRDFWEGAYYDFLSKYYEQLYKKVYKNDELLENEQIL